MADTEKTFKKNEPVTWHSQGKTIEGVVEKKLTGTSAIKGHTVHATKDEPEYLVKSNKTGAEAAHHPSALSKSGAK